MDSTKYFYELILAEQKELLVCHKCQNIKLYNFTRPAPYGSNNILVNVYQSNRSSAVADIKQGCVIILKKLSRHHLDALITVSQKEYLLQIIFNENCITCCSANFMTLLINVHKKLNKIIKIQKYVYPMFVHSSGSGTIF